MVFGLPFLIFRRERHQILLGPHLWGLIYYGSRHFQGQGPQWNMERFQVPGWTWAVVGATFVLDVLPPNTPLMNVTLKAVGRHILSQASPLALGREQVTIPESDDMKTRVPKVTRLGNCWCLLYQGCVYDTLLPLHPNTHTRP